MARSGSSVLGIFGSGGMASTHAWAIANVRPIKRIKVYSPNVDHREAFARRLSQDMSIEVVAVNEPQEVVAGSDIVAACTNSTMPVLRGEWLESGMHLLAVSAAELDDDVLRRCDRYVYSRPPYTDHQVAVPADQMPDSVPMKAYLSDRWIERERRLLPGEKIEFLSDVLLGKAPGRRAEKEITCFASHGIPIQFAATAYRVHQLARERGLGRELPLAWFLQDIRH
jgi:ornithine cyclodeaminase/alanine dehydrogenase-like protein (mu-crystallin family)